jgi:hypothetical protein
VDFEEVDIVVDELRALGRLVYYSGETQDISVVRLASSTFSVFAYLSS